MNWFMQLIVKNNNLNDQNVKLSYNDLKVKTSNTIFYQLVEIVLLQWSLRVSLQSVEFKVNVFRLKQLHARKLHKK